MLPYYTVFCFLCFCSFLEALCIKREQRLILLLLIWLILTLFAGLRYGNADWDTYYDMYKEVINGNNGGGADVGFNLICKILSLFSNNPLIMFIFVASAATAFNLNSFKKYSPYFLICVLYYFVHLYVLKEMIQIRVGLSSAICLYTIRFLPEKKYKYFFGWWLAAVLIHLSAVIWVVVGLINKRAWTIKILIVILLISLCVGATYPLGQLIKIYAVEIDQRLSAYIAYGDAGYAAKLGILTNINTLKSLLLSIVLLYYNAKLSSMNRYFMPLLYAYITGVCWLVLFNDFAIIAARISNILLSVEPVLISLLMVVFPVKTRWIFVVLLVILTFFMLLMNMSPDKITPYQFYFS